MHKSVFHSVILLAVLLVVGCKASRSVLDAQTTTFRDSYFVHVFDSTHTRSIFYSLVFSMITRDKVIKLERVFRDLGTTQLTVHDTAATIRRDTVTIHQAPAPARCVFDWDYFIITWFTGLILGGSLYDFIRRKQS